MSSLLRGRLGLPRPSQARPLVTEAHGGLSQPPACDSAPGARPALPPYGPGYTPPCTLSPSRACQLASLVSGPEGCCLLWAPQAWPSKRRFKGEYSRLVPKFCSYLGGSRPKSAPGSSADSLLAGLAPGTEEGHPWRLHSNSTSLGRGGLFGWLEGSPRKWPDVESGRLPSGLWPRQSGESGINHTPRRQLGSSPVLLGPDVRAPGGPHGASRPPGLRSSGLVLHTRSWLAGGCCLCVVRVVTVIQPPATWPQRLARMLVTTPWARAGAPKCVKVAVLGLGWRSGCTAPRPPPRALRQQPAGTSGPTWPASRKARWAPQAARTGDGCHTGEHTADSVTSPARPPASSKH